MSSALNRQERSKNISSIYSFLVVVSWGGQSNASKLKIARAGHAARAEIIVFAH